MDPTGPPPDPTGPLPGPAPSRGSAHPPAGDRPTRPSGPAPDRPGTPEPSGESPHRRPSPLESHRARLADEIRAYPGDITYLDLIRKNKRRSAVLIVAMLALVTALGAVIAAAVGIYVGRGGEIEDFLPSLVLGAAAGLVFASLGAAWSWFSGASAILRMSGAHEINKADDPELFNVVDEVRIAAGLPMPRVFIINDTALNAFATGRDPDHAVVAVTKGLRRALSRDELQGVVAHEMAHVRHYDIRFAMLMATMVGLVVFACDAFLRMTFYSHYYGGRSYRSRSSGKGGGAAMIVIFLIAILLAIIAPVLAHLIQMSYSRKREYLADAGAVELTRNPEGLASALARIAGDPEPLVEAANRGTAHMFITNPLKKARKAKGELDSVFSTHPPIAKRIAALLALTR